MKESGIEWIGSIPNHWTVSRLKFCSKIDSGEMISKDEFDEHGQFAVIGSNGEIGRTNKYNNQTPVITTGRVGTVGTVQIVSNAWITDNALIINPQVNINYLKHIIPNFDFDAMLSGTAQPLITATKLANQHIPMPSETEQDRIANYLDKKCAEVDALIAAKEKTNALLKEQRQSIIYEAVTKGLNLDAPMKDSGIEWIGEIPTDWDVCPIKYLLDKDHPYPIGDGDHGMIKADDYLSEGIPYIRVLNLTWGDGLNLETLVYISEEMNNRIKNSELKPNDILIAKTGATIGKTAIVPASLPRSNTTSHVGKITISSDHDPKFFYYVMTSSIIQTQIKMLSAMQSTRPELGIDGLRNLLTVVPPVERQREIAEYLDHQCTELNSAITTNASVLEKLKEYRQSIIYEAVTGKIEI